MENGRKGLLQRNHQIIEPFSEAFPRRFSVKNGSKKCRKTHIKSPAMEYLFGAVTLPDPATLLSKDSTAGISLLLLLYKAFVNGCSREILMK